MTKAKELNPWAHSNIPVQKDFCTTRASRRWSPPRADAPIYTAGQVSIDERGALVGAADLAAQTAQAMRNVGLALSAVGASFADIVKITTYVVNYKPEHRSIIGKARAPFFANGTPPASTLVGVAALAMPEWTVEIEAIAVVD
jgi:enamine deaminase RidA (YjgF/YER057c/UK114 family)